MKMNFIWSRDEELPGIFTNTTFLGSLKVVYNESADKLRFHVKGRVTYAYVISIEEADKFLTVMKKIVGEKKYPKSINPLMKLIDKAKNEIEENN